MRVRRRHARRPPGERSNLTRDLFERVITRRTLPAVAHVDAMGVVEKLSFADLARRTARWSWLLRALGVTDGDRVVVVGGRRPDWLAATLAALNGGAIGVPLPESATTEDVEATVRHAGASLVLAPSALVGERDDLGGAAVLRIDDAQGALADQPTSAPTFDTVGRDVAMLLYERDADGELRAAAHTHGSLLAQTDAGELWLRATPGDRLWSTAEPGTAESIWSALAAWSQATELVITEGEPAGEDAARLMELLVIELLWLTPDRYRGLAEIEWPRWVDAPQVRAAVSSSPVDDDVVEAFAAAYGARIRSGYLRPETGLLAGEPADGPRRTGTLGVPLPGRELATMDGRGGQPEPGEAGELSVRAGSTGVFAGWWSQRELRPLAPRGGWHRLGEPAALDSDGFLRRATADEAARVAAERIDAAAGERRVADARAQAERDERAAQERAQTAEKQRRKEAREQARAEEQQRREAERAEKARLKAAEQERRAEERRQAELRKRDELEQRRQEKAQAEAETARQREAAAEERKAAELHKREVQEQAKAEATRQREAAAAAAAAAALEREHAESRELERRRAEKEAQRRAAEEQRAAEEARRREEARRTEEEAARLLEESRQRDELAKRRREIEAAEQERRRAAEAEAERRAAEAARIQEEERRRREIEAAEHERRRAEEEERQRAAAEREEQERRRAAAERGEQERRRADEAERRRAAAEQARREEEQRRQAQLEQRRKAQEDKAPEPPQPAAAPAEGEPDAPNPSLVARIGAYSATPEGRRRPPKQPPPERNGSDDEAA